MLLGLGWPQWLLIIGLVAALLLTFKVMARASVAYERARQRREQQGREQQGREQHLAADGDNTRTTHGIEGEER